MLSYRLGTVNDSHWGFKPVLRYSKPHTFSTLFGEENEINMHLLSPYRPFRSWTNDREVKRSKIKKKGVKKKSKYKGLLPLKIITGP